MALTGPQKIPFAVTSGSSWYGDNYTGTPFEANVGVVHTTEGTTLPSYGGGVSAPNVTGVPDFTKQIIKWYQHYDVDRSSRALLNKAGGVETNTLNAFQVELVGTCDPRTRDRWKAEGRKFIYWPDAPDWALREVAKLVRWLSDNHRIQIKSTVTWRPYPSSYGEFAGQRLDGAQWQKYYGWLGHQHVPENDHGDPGDLDFDRIIQFALGEAPSGGNGVALTTDDIKKIFRTDDVVQSPDKVQDGGYWAFATYVRETYLRTQAAEKNTEVLRKDLAAARKEIAALKTLIEGLKK